MEDHEVVHLAIGKVPAPAERSVCWASAIRSIDVFRWGTPQYVRAPWSRSSLSMDA